MRYTWAPNNDLSSKAEYTSRDTGHDAMDVKECYIVSIMLHKGWWRSAIHMMLLDKEEHELVQMCQDEGIEVEIQI